MTKLQKKMGFVGKVVQQLGIVLISGTALFVFNLAEAPANSIDPELPEFREPTGLSSEAKLAKTHP